VVGENVMADDVWTLERFYTALETRGGRDGGVPLIGSWTDQRRAQIRDCLAPQCQALLGTVVPHLLRTDAGEERSNQSRGNVVADFVSDQLGCQQLLVEPLAGGGYPDRRAVAQDGFACAVELKATSSWNDGDGNRRVLTSSSTKLHRAMRDGILPSPPMHLLVTAIFSLADQAIKAVRLDFLEPTSVVNVRLEASTSQALLMRGEHTSERFT
jgi:hypothetical protein